MAKLKQGNRYLIKKRSYSPQYRTCTEVLVVEVTQGMVKLRNLINSRVWWEHKSAFQKGDWGLDGWCIVKNLGEYDAVPFPGTRK